VSAAS
jgi:aryl-alcohol dehydrogenase-like predicted oxidoreductase